MRSQAFDRCACLVGWALLAAGCIALHAALSNFGPPGGRLPQAVTGNASQRLERIEGWPEAQGTLWGTFGWRRRRTVARRHLVPQEEYPKARCLDGTPPAIYIRRSSSRKWLLFLEGWGFCFSLEDCLGRAGTSHGSTEGEPHHLDLRSHGPYFSSDKVDNPLLHNFNWVFVRYCDGGYFAGDVAEPVDVNTSAGAGRVYFRGRYIREAVVDFLRRRHGLAEATDVILAGCSSGAIATLFSVNTWRELMPWVPNVLAFSDSGYFLDVGGDYSGPKAFIYLRQNASSSLAPECVRQHWAAPWECFVAANALPYARTPVFAWQSRYDSNQLDGRLCLDGACTNAFGRDLQASLEAAMAQQSYFVDGCYRHCSGGAPALNAEGVTPLQALQQWYNNLTVQIVQSGSYPCDDCCYDDDYDIGKVIYQ